MHSAKRLKVMDLNPHLTCVLCGGYFIEATTIIECLHSFCKTCIIRYLETSKFCPICDVQVHKTKPMTNIRADKTLQDIVYKLVPGLFQNEMKRRRECYSKDDVTGPPVAVVSPEDRGEIPDHRLIYTPDESISLSLEYGFGKNQKPSDSTSNGDPESKAQRRFLRCPAGITVLHLKKFLRLKYGLQPIFEVDMMYHDDSLDDDYTLMDLAYIYSWRRNEPMRLFYRIYQRPKKRPKPEEPAPQPEVEVVKEAKESPPPTPPKPVTPTLATAPTPPDSKPSKKEPLPTPSVSVTVPAPPTGLAPKKVLPTIIIREPLKPTVSVAPANKVTVVETKQKESKPEIQKEIPAKKTAVPSVTSVPVPPTPTPSVPELQPAPRENVKTPVDIITITPVIEMSATATKAALSEPLTPAPPPTVEQTPLPQPSLAVAIPISVAAVPTPAASPPSVPSAPEPTRTHHEKKKVVAAPPDPPPLQIKILPVQPPQIRKEVPKIPAPIKERKHSSDSHNHHHHYPPEKKKRVSDGRSEKYSIEEKRKKEKRVNAISEQLLISLPRNNVVNNNHHQHRSPPPVSSPKLAEPPVANASPVSAPIPTPPPPPIAPVTVVLDRRHRKEVQMEPTRDDIGALDLSVSNRHDRPSSHSRPRHVANPAVLDKHRLITCLPAPKYHSFIKISSSSSSSSSSSPSVSKKSDGSRKHSKLTVINPDPTSYRPKIVIKGLEPRPDNHHHSHHHNHHHRRLS